MASRASHPRPKADAFVMRERRGYNILGESKSTPQSRGRRDDVDTAKAFGSTPTRGSGCGPFDKGDHVRRIESLAAKIRAENKMTSHLGRRVDLNLLSKIVGQSKVDEIPAVTLHFDHQDFDATDPPTPRRWVLMPLNALSELLFEMERLLSDE